MKAGAVYNLIIGFLDGEAVSDRVLEWTEDSVTEWVAPAGVRDYSRLRNLPTLVMPELQDDRHEQVARVGHVEDLSSAGRTVRFRFVPDSTLPTFGTGQVEQLAAQLQIGDWEFNRTHWAVKNVDLYRVLREALGTGQPAPTVFRLPTELPPEADLVAAMMPFDASFAAVYESLTEAAASAGMVCRRADNIWVNEHIMDDVLNLLWRARVVIADLSGKNANVFYETGIAHTLGREVILISQSMDDVPFDLRSIRTVLYHNNGEGRENLRDRIRARLTDIRARL